MMAKYFDACCTLFMCAGKKKKTTFWNLFTWTESPTGKCLCFYSNCISPHVAVEQGHTIAAFYLMDILESISFRLLWLRSEGWLWKLDPPLWFLWVGRVELGGNHRLFPLFPLRLYFLMSCFASREKSLVLGVPATYKPLSPRLY